MNPSPAISVIIPYFNGNADDFKKCINSILNQSFGNFEIIVINDGSSSEYVSEIIGICASDNRIRLITQENQGVSAARNRGTAEAKGDYIVYIDADDLVLPYFFAEAYKIAMDKNTDILYSFNCRTKDENTLPYRNNDPDVSIPDKSWIMEHTLGAVYHSGEKHFGRGPWARFLKAEFAKKFTFPLNVPLGEDVIWNIKILKQTNSFALVDQIWYLYMDRDYSVTGKYDPDIEKKIKPFYENVEKFINLDSNEKFYYYDRIYRDLKKYIFESYLGNPQNQLPFSERNKLFKQICTQDPWKKIGEKAYFSHSGMKNKIKIFLFKTRIIYYVWMFLHIKRQIFSKK